MTEDKMVMLLNAFHEGQSEAVVLGNPELRYEYTNEDGTKGTFGSVRKVFRVINKELTGSEKFVVGIAVFAPGEGGPVHVHENAEEFSYIISGGGVQLDKDNRICGYYKKGDFKLFPEAHTTAASALRTSPWSSCFVIQRAVNFQQNKGVVHCKYCGQNSLGAAWAYGHVSNKP